MKLNALVQRGAVFVLVMVGMFAAPVLTNAQKNEPIERFTADVTNVTGTPMQIRVDLLRWSTEAEREKVFSTFTAKGDKELLASFKDVPTHGYLWTSESAGYVIRYAHREVMADGVERIVVMTDRPLGAWNPYIWRPVSGVSSPVDYGFTLLELRLSGKGPGEGKASVLAKIAADQQGKVLALENWAGAPAVLKNVKRMQRGYADAPISEN
jgi:hypothetical protein